MALLALLVSVPAAPAAGPPEAAPAQPGTTPPPEPATVPEQPAAPVHWAQPQIDAVVAAGLFAPTAAEFRPDDPLLWGDLAAAIGVLTGKAPKVLDPVRPITLAQLDAWLVRALGLSPVASQVLQATRGAGLEPPKRIGTETVARLLGLRLNHEGANEALELVPGAVATRAEAAFSFARALELSGTDLSWVGAKVATLAIPPLADWQRRVLARAARFVGFPYVWGGTSENAQELFGAVQPGGFDCSGFIWRAYRTEVFPEAPQLAATLVGRTTYEMSAEIAEPARIPFEALAPADVVFFGTAGVKSKPAQIGHVGMLLAPGWMIHSSRYGTTIAPLEGWYVERFAWARRPLAEAGLA